MIKKITNFVLTHNTTWPAFLIVGFTTAFIYFATFTLFWKWVGLSYTLSVSVSYFVAILFHFNANRFFTFKNHEQSMIRQLSRYAFLILINYVITVLILRLTVEVLNLSPYLGIIFSVGITVNFSYLIARYWVFPIMIKEKSV